jgi:hypothetical protein
MARREKLDLTDGHVDRETGTDAPHRNYRGRFTCGSETYPFTFDAPVRVMDVIGKEDAEKILSLVNDLFVKMLVIAVPAGVHDAVQVCFDEAKRTYIANLWRTFQLKMVKEGTDYRKLAWLVPSTMQEVMEEN